MQYISPEIKEKKQVVDVQGTRKLQIKNRNSKTHKECPLFRQMKKSQKTKTRNGSTT